MHFPRTDVYTDALPHVSADRHHPLQIVGAINCLRWGKTYVLQNEATDEGIMIRVVHRGDGVQVVPDSPSPISLHHGDPPTPLHADMGNLLARLQLCGRP